MNILGLVASGRKLGNSEILAKEMLTDLEGEKRLLRLSDLAVEPCQACYACLPAGKPCVIDDDFAFFLEQLAWADVVVIAAPCYFLGAHTSLKTIGDRLIAVLNDGERFQGKRCVAVVTYGVADWEGYSREMVMNFARFLHLDLRGTLLVQAANPGEVVHPDVLAEARALAGRLIGDDSIAIDKTSTHVCGGCGSSLLQLNSSGQVRCVMCGLTGQMTVDAGRFAITFKPSDHSRFSPKGMAEHGQRLETIKAEYIANRKGLMALRKKYQEQDEWWVRPSR